MIGKCAFLRHLYLFIKKFCISLGVKASIENMQSGQIERICNFLASRPRYKLVVCHSNPFADIKPLNLGYSISKSITQQCNRSMIAYDMAAILDKTISQASIDIGDVGKAVVIENLGILFESELGVLPVDVILKHAKHMTVILIWNGDYRDNKLWLKNSSTYTIDISNINHIAL